MQITRTQKEFCKNFDMKRLGEYHDKYIQSDTLLLADRLENLRNICYEMSLTLLVFFSHQD